MCTDKSFVIGFQDEESKEDIVNISLYTVFASLIVPFVEDIPQFCVCLGMPYSILYDENKKILYCKFDTERGWFLYKQK